jgi:hypothetical protein
VRGGCAFVALLAGTIAIVFVLTAFAIGRTERSFKGDFVGRALLALKILKVLIGRACFAITLTS